MSNQNYPYFNYFSAKNLNLNENSKQQINIPHIRPEFKIEDKISKNIPLKIDHKSNMNNTNNKSYKLSNKNNQSKEFSINSNNYTNSEKYKQNVSNHSNIYNPIINNQEKKSNNKTKEKEDIFHYNLINNDNVENVKKNIYSSLNSKNAIAKGKEGNLKILFFEI